MEMLTIAGAATSWNVMVGDCRDERLLHATFSQQPAKERSLQQLHSPGKAMCLQAVYGTF
jgi:hypothetical protein